MIVEDANEQAPVFDMERYSGSVLEGQGIGQFVLRVRRDGGAMVSVSFPILGKCHGAKHRPHHWHQLHNCCWDDRSVIH